MNEQEAFKDIAKNYGQRIIAIVYDDKDGSRFCKIDNISIDDHGHVFIHCKRPYAFTPHRPVANGVKK